MEIGANQLKKIPGIIRPPRSSKEYRSATLFIVFREAFICAFFFPPSSLLCCFLMCLCLSAFLLFCFVFGFVCLFLLLCFSRFCYVFLSCLCFAAYFISSLSFVSLFLFSALYFVLLSAFAFFSYSLLCCSAWLQVQLQLYTLKTAPEAQTTRAANTKEQEEQEKQQNNKNNKRNSNNDEGKGGTQQGRRCLFGFGGGVAPSPPCPTEVGSKPSLNKIWDGPNLPLCC